MLSYNRSAPVLNPYLPHWIYRPLDPSTVKFWIHRTLDPSTWTMRVMGRRSSRHGYTQYLHGKESSWGVGCTHFRTSGLTVEGFRAQELCEQGHGLHCKESSWGVGCTHVRTSGLTVGGFRAQKLCEQGHGLHCKESSWGVGCTHVRTSGLTVEGFRAQELCEQGHGLSSIPRPILPPAPINHTVSVDVKHHRRREWFQS